MNFSGPLFLLCGNLLFATNGIWVSYAPIEATPMTLAGCRMFIGAVFLFLWLKVSRRSFPLCGWNKKNVFIYAFGLWGFQICLFESIRLVGMSVGVTVAIASSPIFTAILERIIRGKNPIRIWYVATAIAIAGIVLLNPMQSEKASLACFLCPLGAGFCSAVTLIVGSRLNANPNTPPESAVALVSSIACAFFIPFFFFNDVTWILTGSGLLSVVMLGLVNCALAYTLILAGLRRTQASLSASLGLAEPMGAALMGILLLGEPCTPRTILGIVLILLSVILLIFTSHHQTKPIENDGMLSKEHSL